MSENQKNVLSQIPTAIVIAGLAGLLGWQTSQTTATVKIESLERRVDKIESRLDERSDFMVCAVRTLDRLKEESGVRSFCPLTVPK